MQFYRDLAAFETRVLATMVRLSARMPADRRRAVEESNIKPMQNLIAGFERRAGLWLERLTDLSSKDPAPK